MKYLLLVFLMLIIPSYCLAIEEVLLEVDDNKMPENSINKVFDEDDGITLYEQIQNIQTKEVKDTNSSAYLLDGILTKKFETGPIETMHLFGYYRGSVDMDLSNGGDSVYDFSAIQAGINGKFRGGQNYYEARFRFDPV